MAIKLENLAPEERELRLLQASAMYVEGEIDIEEFNEAERQYGTDFGSAMQELAKIQRSANSSGSSSAIGEPRSTTDHAMSDGNGQSSAFLR